MLSPRLLLRFIIYSILCFSFFAGLPQLHYGAAIMIATIIRYKDHPQGLFAPIDSHSLW